jgi:murein DD-endopeptidase MepM/ murein hydrolase activator NlpD
MRTTFFSVVVLAVLASLLWLGRSHLPPIAKTPFYSIYLTFQKAPQTLPIPVEDVKSSQLIDTWKAARSNNRFHQGIDIFARRGTSVLSTTEGIVLRVGTNDLGGKVVWVLGPGGDRHYYAHLDRYAEIDAGDRVSPGSVLGYVGNTGNARGTPTHLHYGIYTGSGAVNPYPFLKSSGNFSQKNVVTKVPASNNSK